MNRIAAIFMCACGLVLAGCGVMEEDPNTITVWHWMNDRHDALEELASRYQQKTGITVNFQLFAPSDVYSQKITAAAQARILPDIFGILDKKSVVGDFINAGFVANLKDAYSADNDAWHKRIFEKALVPNHFAPGNPYDVEPGYYGVPLDVMNIQMVYNKDLLQQAGIENPPQTFDAFLQAAEKLKGLNVTPFVTGWGELWLIDCFSSNYAFNIMGKEKVMETYRGNVAYTDEDWIKVFTIFQTLAGQGLVDNDIVTKSNKFAEQDFALERAAFAFNGSWGVNVYHGMNPDLDYGVMRPPPISREHELKIWGGPGGSFMVNAASSRKTKAIDFLKWLTAKEQQVYLSEETKNLPANRHALADLPPELAEFGKAMDQTTHPSIWPVEEDALVKEKFTKGIQSILIGERTPEDVAQEVQRVKERQMGRAERRAR
ncbi:MAG: ABC transporter substrate-binding protein [Candidatus Omnitrophota bacterium]